MKHKYLYELFPDDLYPNDALPFPFGAEDYPEFDERDTFSLDYTFLAWLYERLRYFQEEASQIVNFDFHKFNVNGEELTQTECIARMVEDCKALLLDDGIWAPDSEEWKALDATKNDLFDVFKAVFWAMWW